MPLNDRGTLTPFRLPPPDACWEELKEPVVEYRELVARRHAAYSHVGVLENKRVKAIETDRKALAKALREGGKDPGDKSVEKIDKEIANTRRIIESLEIAIDEAESDLMGVVDENQLAWLEDVDVAIDADANAYVAAIEQVEAARTKLAASVALKRFLNTFPEHGYNAGHWPVYSLIARNGDPFRWDEITEALRKDAEVARKPAQKREQQEAATGFTVHEHELRVPDPGGSYIDRKLWGAT